MVHSGFVPSFPFTLLLLVVLTFLSTAVAAATTRPHIVHIMADDLGRDNLGRQAPRIPTILA
jgi:hypothetical protein